MAAAFVIASGLASFLIGMTNGRFKNIELGRPLSSDEKLGLIAVGVVLMAIGFGMVLF